MTETEKKYLVAEPVAAWGSMLILLACYWLTVAPSVSFWDCPEYVSAAYLLEVGHPPGNPVWMLVERMVTLLVPPRHAALAINLSSGLLTAFAAFFLAKTIFRAGLWVLLKLPRRHIPAPLAAAGAALTGALAFGLCDSVWYSAVEAEVYAMSIFMTSLCVWLMAKWAGTRSRGDSWRLLVLIAYLFGLSVGIHQLNLLCIPALAMIWAVRRGIRNTGRLVIIFLLSLAVVACVLVGMMPSTIAIAARFELLAVNGLGLPALWGVAAYVILLGVSLLVALFAVGRRAGRVTMAVACFPAIFLSGIFVISEHFVAGMVVSGAVAVLLVCGASFKARRLYLAIWMLAMLLTGYASYALIPIRGSVPSPANGVMPGEPFSFAAYQSREQYGAKPLLYGATPYSRNLFREDVRPDGSVAYSRYVLDYRTPMFVPKVKGARLRASIPGLSEADSVANARVLASEGDGYVVRSVRLSPRKTPELNMWFPRITSSRPEHLRSYAEWIGMDTATMVRVGISETVDSAGNCTGRLDSSGKRKRAFGYRPTYLQNLQWLASYQTGYMYWRYLLWNFVGRQNDRPAQGEVQHGNFITGFMPLDKAMLGAEDSLPPVAGSDNAGRNRYFGLPFLLAVLGIIWLLKSRRRGKQACAVIAILFVMTGLAITVYLNQDPGEARERDYSFLGSYMAFCMWIGFGAVMIARRFRSVYGFLVPLAVVAWMGVENFGDHDRSGRNAARNFAISVLESLEPDAVLFVNGDNNTFPLWYAQEVEGIRTDVRVVNLAYLQTPTYAANLMRDWRDSKGVPSVFMPQDILYEAFGRVRTGHESGAAPPDAVDALVALRDSDASAFTSRFVMLRVSPDSAIRYDLRNLAMPGSSSVEFMKLMMFNIVASASGSARPRPVYWITGLTSERRIGLPTVPWLYGRRFGVMDAREADSLLAEGIKKMRAPNVRGRKVYMDRAPSLMVSTQRAPVTYAARLLLDHGRLAEAAEGARRADILLGDSPDSYISTLVGDSIFVVRRELGELLVACADSIARRAAADSLLSPDKKKRLEAESLELRARGLYHLREYRSRNEAWQRYRNNLPPRLQNKMAPVY